MLLELLVLNLPALHRVTFLTIGAELAAVNIRVTICAPCAHIREHKIRVALLAVHFLVHAAQWVAGSVVIEFRIISDRFPTCIRVAIFAGIIDGPVRVPARLFVSLPLSKCLPGGRDGQEQEQERNGLCRSHRTPTPFNGRAGDEKNDDA